MNPCPKCGCGDSVSITYVPKRGEDPEEVELYCHAPNCGWSAAFTRDHGFDAGAN